MKLALAVSSVLVFLVWGFWIVAIPEGLITDRIAQGLKRGPLSAEVLSLKKGLWYDFRADIAAKVSGKPVLTVSNLQGRINPLGLLMLKLPFSFQGDAAGGRISGSLDLLRNGEDARISVSGVQIGKLPVLKSVGIEGEGSLSGELLMKGLTGEVTAEVNPLSLKNLGFGGLTVPLEHFHNARAALSLRGNTLSITSFALEGEGLYARIKGRIENGRPDLVMELMPEKTFIEKMPLMRLLDTYRVSPGFYVIPLTGAMPAGV